jgi:hypothetical protein
VSCVSAVIVALLVRVPYGIGGLAQSFQGIDEAEPADESLFGAVLHPKESSDRLAPELELELDGQLPLSASGGVVHRNRRYALLRSVASGRSPMSFPELSRRSSSG